MSSSFQFDPVALKSFICIAESQKVYTKPMADALRVVQQEKSRLRRDLITAVALMIIAIVAATAISFPWLIPVGAGALILVGLRNRDQTKLVESQKAVTQLKTGETAALNRILKQIEECLQLEGKRKADYMVAVYNQDPHEGDAAETKVQTRLNAIEKAFDEQEGLHCGVRDLALQVLAKTEKPADFSDENWMQFRAKCHTFVYGPKGADQPYVDFHTVVRKAESYWQAKSWEVAASA